MPKTPELLLIERDEDFVIYQFCWKGITIKFQGFEEIIIKRNESNYFLRSLDVDGHGANSLGKNIFKFKRMLGKIISERHGINN